MDDGAITVEGAEACQGELTIEHGSVGNGIIDADGTQLHGAERVSDAQGVQLVGGNGSMVSGGIVTRLLGTAEEVGSGPEAADEEGNGTMMMDKPTNWSSMSKTQRRRWFLKVQRASKREGDR